MSDTDRLAALLADNGGTFPAYGDHVWQREAARLIAAGVTLAPTPPDAPRYSPSRDGDMDPDPHGEWVRYDTDDGWQERGNPGDDDAPSPPDAPHDCQTSIAINHDLADRLDALRDCGCAHNRDTCPTPPDALDVERLARAMRDMCDCIRSDEDATVWARDIAEEYAKEPKP